MQHPLRDMKKDEQDTATFVLFLLLSFSFPVNPSVIQLRGPTPHFSLGKHGTAVVY
jgi:hypothetical protein